MVTMKSLAVAVAIAGGAMGLAGPASAAPVGTGATVAGSAAGAPVEPVQYGYGYGGPRYGYGGPGYGGGYYGRRRFGPPVVCRFRPTPYGPRRVCFRRY